MVIRNVSLGLKCMVGISENLGMGAFSFFRQPCMLAFCSVAIYLV